MRVAIPTSREQRRAIRVVVYALVFEGKNHATVSLLSAKTNLNSIKNSKPMSSGLTRMTIPADVASRGVEFSQLMKNSS